MYFEIELSGAKIARFHLLRYAGRSMDLSRPLDEIGRSIRAQIGLNFLSEGQFRSDGWQALSKAEIAHKAYLRSQGKHADPRVLRLNDDLMKSLMGNGPGSVYKVTRGSLKVGSRLPYARRQNRGGGGIPPRPFLKQTHQDQIEHARTLLRYIVSERS